MSDQRLKVVFMGSPELAVPTLRCLHERCDVRCVVTQPDRPAGRGRSLRAPPVKEAALELGLPVWQPETLRGAESDERLQGHDLFVVLAYGELLRQPVLDLPTACINLHASLLPRWRGASPLQAALRAGDRQTGVSVMRMVRALDAGPVYHRMAFDLDSDATLPWLHDRIAEVSAQAMAEFLDRWPAIEAVDQDEQLVTKCGKLDSTDGRIDWQATSAEIERQVRAYHPVPGCWCQLGDQRLRVQRVQVLDPALAPSGSSGSTALVEGLPAVRTADGAVVLEMVQPAGSRAMPARDWLNGYTLPEHFG